MCEELIEISLQSCILLICIHLMYMYECVHICINRINLINGRRISGRIKPILLHLNLKNQVENDSALL
jgi:hypothetical protein